jgi:hypothetical protein
VKHNTVYVFPVKPFPGHYELLYFLSMYDANVFFEQTCFTAAVYKNLAVIL